MRRYFILDRVSPNEFEALEMCIGAMETQTYSLDGLKLLIKTKQSDINNYLGGDTSILGTEYTYEEIDIILQSSEWQLQETI